MRRRIVTAAFRAFNRSRQRMASDNSISPSCIKHILISRPNHRLGNLLLTTALLAELERLFPGAEVDVIVGSSAGSELLAKFPRVRRVMNLTPRIVQHPFLLLSVLNTIRAARYDLAIDPTHGSTSGRILMLAAGAANAVWIEQVPLDELSGAAPRPQHLARLPIDAVRRALCTSATEQLKPYPPLSIRLTSIEKQKARKVLSAVAKTDRGVVGVFAEATGDKRYDEAWWLQLIDHMRSQRGDLVFVELIAAHGQSRLGDRYPAFYSTDARHLCAVISQLECFISADCGVMHLAASSGATTIGLFATTDPLRYQPYGGHSQFIRTENTSPEDVADACLHIIMQGEPMHREQNALK